MSRYGRHVLFASVIALHAIVTLCGQCLHEFAGSSHQLGLTSKAQGADDLGRSPRDAADNCLICHFVAQSQLPVDCYAQVAVAPVATIPLPFLQVRCSVRTHVPSSPRAPPRALPI